MSTNLNHDVPKIYMFCSPGLLFSGTPPTEPVEGSENGIWTAPPKEWSCILPHIGVCAVQLSAEILVLKSKICQRGTFAAPHSV